MIAPGFIAQSPAGNPESVMLPVAVEQVGCTIPLTIGEAGVPGLAIITTAADATELHPRLLVTV